MSKQHESRGGSRLRTKVITLRQAGEFIRHHHHRHHKPTAGHKFSIVTAVSEKSP